MNKCLPQRINARDSPHRKINSAQRGLKNRFLIFGSLKNSFFDIGKAEEPFVDIWKAEEPFVDNR